MHSNDPSDRLWNRDKSSRTSLRQRVIGGARARKGGRTAGSCECCARATIATAGTGTIATAIGVSDATVATCANASHSRQNPLEATWSNAIATTSDLVFRAWFGNSRCEIACRSAPCWLSSRQKATKDKNVLRPVRIDQNPMSAIPAHAPLTASPNESGRR
jgi:hypothetical protein